MKKPDGMDLIWANPNKKPWRELTAITSYLDSQSRHDANCQQITACLSKLGYDRKEIGIWSGGLMAEIDKVGGQKVSAGNDFVESLVTIAPNEDWFNAFKVSMHDIESMGNLLYFCTIGYLEQLGVMDKASEEKKKKHAEKAEQKLGKKYKTPEQLSADSCNDQKLREIKETIRKKEKHLNEIADRAERTFWEKCDSLKQSIIDNCDDPIIFKDIKKKISNFLIQCYNEACPCSTARQIAAWAANKPNVARFLK